MNLSCSQCQHSWESKADSQPEKCPACRSRAWNRHVEALPKESGTPAPSLASEAPNVPSSAKPEHPLEVASRKAREEAGATLCPHDKWSYPKGHADYQWGCPACIELAKPKSDLAAKAFIAANEATVKAGKK